MVHWGAEVDVIVLLNAVVVVRHMIDDGHISRVCEDEPVQNSKNETCKDNVQASNKKLGHNQFMIYNIRCLESGLCAALESKLEEDTTGFTCTDHDRMQIVNKMGMYRAVNDALKGGTTL